MSRLNHSWRFFRAGGVCQVRLDSGADLLALDQLDQTLWMALACPVEDLAFDRRTLALLDADGDGRIRAPDVIAAVRWVARRLKHPDDLLKHTDFVPLDALDDSTPEGGTLRAAALKVLASLGKPDATGICLSDVEDLERILAGTTLNGDGVIVPETAADEATRSLIEEILSCMGTVKDRSGRAGVDEALVERFFAECAAWEAWIREGESRTAELWPLGEETDAAVAAWSAVRAKVDDYFQRCRLVAFDPQAHAQLNPGPASYQALGGADLAEWPDPVRTLPLARVAPGRPLPLREGLNPAWMGPIRELERRVVRPLLGERTELTEEDWVSVCERLGPAAAWRAARPVTSVEKLGIRRVREILAGRGREELRRLIALDRAEEPAVQAIRDLEKLLRFHRDLHLFCQNFVNFRDFYDRGEPAIFQFGTLYLDQRACSLCLRVEDPARHAGLASAAGAFLAYCECVRKATGEKMYIVAAFTDGDSDHLAVGRNGVFYDRQGRDWDATIVRLVEHPISLREAFWRPYKKLARFVEEQVAQRAAATEKNVPLPLPVGGEPAAAAKKTGLGRADLGLVAALGLTVGASGTAFGTLAGYITGFVKLPFWKVCVALAALMMVVSGPYVVLAWLKLRKRNLGPLLDANGWALNTRARINVPFGTSLTRVGNVPVSAVIGAGDPFAERRPWAPWVAALVLVVCFLYSLFNSHGWIHRWTGGRWGQPPPTVQGRAAATGGSPAAGGAASAAQGGPGPIQPTGPGAHASGSGTTGVPAGQP